MLQIKKVLVVGELDFGEVYVIETFYKSRNRLHMAIGTKDSTTVCVDYETGDTERVIAPVDNKNVQGLVNMPFLSAVVVGLEEEFGIVKYDGSGYEYESFSSNWGESWKIRNCESICRVDDTTVCFCGYGTEDYGVQFINIETREVIKKIEFFSETNDKVNPKDVYSSPEVHKGLVFVKSTLESRRSIAGYNLRGFGRYLFIVDSQKYQVLNTVFIGTDFSIDYLGSKFLVCVDQLKKKVTSLVQDGNSQNVHESFSMIGMNRINDDQTDLLTEEVKMQDYFRGIETSEVFLKSFGRGDVKRLCSELEGLPFVFSLLRYSYGEGCHIFLLDDVTSFNHPTIKQTGLVLGYEAEKWRILDVYDSERYMPEYCISNNGRDVFFCYEREAPQEGVNGRKIESVVLHIVNSSVNFFDGIDPDENERIEFLKTFEENSDVFENVEYVKIRSELASFRFFKSLILLL